MLPIKTTFEDVNALTKYLRTQVGWVEIDKAKAAIPKKHVDNRKLEAMKFIGFLDRDGANIKLTGLGQEYADSEGDEAARAAVVQAALRSASLYFETLEWLHHSDKGDQTKTQLASYWHDHHSAKLDGATGAALTDAAIFFMRVVDASGVSHFVPAGKGRPESFLQVDKDSLGLFVLGTPAAPAGGSPPSPGPEGGSTGTVSPPAPLTPAPVVSPPPPVGLTAGLQINVEIHIAADATATTVEEIFRNMRKYILNSDEPPA